MGWAKRIQAAWRNDDGLAQLLRPLGALHAGLLRLRVQLYRLGLKRSATLPVPVIVVGNWIVGGAGKTPTTLYLLEQMAALGLRAGVVSRGYGRDETQALALVTASSTAREVGDEPLLIHLRARVPVAVGRDRSAAARLLLQSHPELQILVSDDGLQHWRLPRQLSVLVFDERGLGNGRLLPAGPLRQRATLPPPPGSAAAQLVLYNAASPSTPLPGYLALRQLHGAVSLQDWWLGRPATPAALQALRGQVLLAAAGMAQPGRFFAMLREAGLSFDELPLPDHYGYQQLPWLSHRGAVLVTEKDAVKLRPEACSGVPVWVVALDFKPEHAFQQALRTAVQGMLR